MKLYDANAGNAKRVRIFIAEKNIKVPREVVELGKGTRSPEFLKLNSLGEVPVLELNDGRILTGSIAICRYLDLIFPKKSLMGKEPFEQGHIEMWSQRMYSELFLPIGLMVRHQLPLFADILEQVPAFADTQRKIMPKKWKWLDQELVDGREFIAGDKFTFADVQGMTALTISDIFDLSPPIECIHATKWAKAMRKRPSWKA